MRRAFLYDLAVKRGAVAEEKEAVLSLLLGNAKAVDMLLRSGSREGSGAEPVGKERGGGGYSSQIWP